MNTDEILKEIRRRKTEEINAPPPIKSDLSRHYKLLQEIKDRQLAKLAVPAKDK